MKKQGFDIQKVISTIWAERHVCYNGNKTYEKMDKAREKLLETLDENQTKIFYDFEDANALLEIETESELISFVLSFMRAIIK